MPLDYDFNHRVDPEDAIRQSLFATGKIIERECCKAKREFEFYPDIDSRDLLLQAVGKLNGFIHIRRSLNNHLGVDFDIAKKEAIVAESMEPVWLC